jgi:hypothetical protein
MLGTITSDHLIASIILLEWNCDLEDMSTRLKDTEDAMDLLALLLIIDPHEVKTCH